ncbi:MAG: hypothetical protein KatS3mg061_2472 [Dehalococcoidia bacterium]|nr:MAG: hypothetical protein KatS3mg061_2472 [Dehalococcoidia bacterium]
MGESLVSWHHTLGKYLLLLAPDDPRLPALVASADVVLEGGPAHPFDLAPLIAQHPHLVHAVLSGFGEGPRAHWTTTELIAQAAGGMLVLNGEPGREPLRVPGEPATALAAQYLAAGILLALRVRRARGRGQRVEVSLQEAVASATEPLLFPLLFRGAGDLPPGRPPLGEGLRDRPLRRWLGDGLLEPELRASGCPACERRAGW